MNTAQWLVTDDGIEGAGDYRGYFIDKARLGERRRGSDGALLDWPKSPGPYSRAVLARNLASVLR